MNHNTTGLGGEPMDKDTVNENADVQNTDDSGDNTTKITPLKKKKKRKRSKKIRVTYTEDDYKMVIDTYTKKPRGYTRMNISRITESYWRVDVWARGNPDEPKSLWNPQRIVDSYFVRVNVADDGTLQYADVSAGHDL